MRRTLAPLDPMMCLRSTLGLRRRAYPTLSPHSTNSKRGGRGEPEEGEGHQDSRRPPPNAHKKGTEKPACHPQRGAVPPGEGHGGTRPSQAIETPTVPPREDASTPTTRTRTPPWGNPGDEDREILASLHVTVLDTWARRLPPIPPSLGAVLGPGLGAGGVGCQSCHWWRGQGSD
jgi:hypothetical protein